MCVPELTDKKRRGERIVVLTAYDFPMARLLDEAGVDIILVGDSLANVALGLPSTTDVGMQEMLYHARAVVRGAGHTLVIADMPFAAYQGDVTVQDAVVNARQFLDAGCGGVKVEWFDRCPEVVRALRAADIPVMGHVGLTPQTAAATGGFRTRGKTPDEAAAVRAQALGLEAAGCFAVVLECVPPLLARDITGALHSPTIGIGAGPHCDGQVLVTHDMLGLTPRAPRFVRSYADLGSATLAAARQYKEDVRAGRFPDPKDARDQVVLLT